MSIILLLSVLMIADLPPDAAEAIQRSREAVAQSADAPKKQLVERLDTVKSEAVKGDDFAGAAAIKRYSELLSNETLPKTDDLSLPDQALGAIDLYKQDLEAVAAKERTKLFETLGKIKDQAAQKEDYATATSIKEFMDENSDSLDFLLPNGEGTTSLLTADEIRQGWKLLFNGKDLSGWHGFKNQPLGSAWTVHEGQLVSFQKGPDLITDEKLGDFELSLEYKTSPQSNSGVFIRVTETGDNAHRDGPEFCIAGSQSGRTDNIMIQGMYTPRKAVANPDEEWNHLRILSRRNRILYFLNGTKVHDFEIGSADWKKRFMRRPPNHQTPWYGRATEGSIGLQTHNGSTSFRNIKIRPL